MYYQLYELNHAFLSPARALNDAVRLYYKNPLNPLTYTQFGRQVAAATDVFERMTRRYGKPEFGLTHTDVNGIRCAVTEETVWERPFCKLIHFKRTLPTDAPKQPNLVIVAPMSGHYATLLRGTVETLLPHFNVHITDWVDARMVPMSAGSFDFGDYVDYVADITRHFGGDVHLIAVCQPTVPVFVAMCALEQNDDVTPKSVTMMGGPLDTRESPTEVNTYAAKHDLDWFRRNVIMPVPLPHPGFMREVYPGFLQLTGFMTMNLDRHLAAHYDYFDHLVEGDGDNADKHRDFYDEYLSVMDLTAEFYLETVDYVFLRQLLPKGEMMHRGQTIDPTAITKTPIFTVEGEKDDISGIGQTKAAHRMTENLPAHMQQHYEQPSVGHYGVFNGSRFRREIAPRIVEFAYRWDGPNPGEYRDDNAGITPEVVEGMIHEASTETLPQPSAKSPIMGIPHVGAMAIAQSFGAASDRKELETDTSHLPATLESAARMMNRPFEQSAGLAADTAEAMSVAVSATVLSATAALDSAVDAGELASGVSQEVAASFSRTTEALATSAVEMARVSPEDVARVAQFADALAAGYKTVSEPDTDAASETEAAVTEATEAVAEVAETLAELAEAATETSAEAADVGVEPTETVAEETVEVSEAAAETVTEETDAVIEAAETVAEETVEVSEAATETAAEATDAIVAATEAVAEETAEVSEAAVEAAAETTDAAAETTEAVAEEAAEAAVEATPEATASEPDKAAPAPAADEPAERTLFSDAEEPTPAPTRKRKPRTPRKPRKAAAAKAEPDVSTKAEPEASAKSTSNEDTPATSAKPAAPRRRRSTTPRRPAKPKS